MNHEYKVAKTLEQLKNEQQQKPAATNVSYYRKNDLRTDD